MTYILIGLYGILSPLLMGEGGAGYQELKFTTSSQGRGVMRANKQDFASNDLHAKISKAI